MTVDAAFTRIVMDDSQIDLSKRQGTSTINLGTANIMADVENGVDIFTLGVKYTF